jgi:hypothetical protein
MPRALVEKEVIIDEGAERSGQNLEVVAGAATTTAAEAGSGKAIQGKDFCTAWVSLQPLKPTERITRTKTAATKLTKASMNELHKGQPESVSRKTKGSPKASLSGLVFPGR